MACCLECGAPRENRVARGELLVTEEPPIAYWQGKRMLLSRMEVRTLHLLARTGRASHDALQRFALGDDSEAITVRTRICQMRRKLAQQGCPLQIVSEHGWGYKLV